MPILNEEIIKPITIQSLSGTEEIVRVDENTAIKYSVHEERIDLGALEIEKRGIEEQLAKIVDDQTLLEWAKANYPYQNIDRARLEARLVEITNLLGVK